MFTNRYIYTYAAIMVIVVAAILSSAAMLLKPMQLANVRAEKIQGILASVEVETTRNTAENVYQDYIVEELAINMDGEIVSRFKDNTLEMGDVRPFEINLKEQLDLKKRLKILYGPSTLWREKANAIS